jgi:hypothetical protein
MRILVTVGRGTLLGAGHARLAAENELGGAALG